MVNRRPEGPRNVETFKDVERPLRRNSTSIRRFFFDLIRSDFGGSATRAAKALSDSLQKANDKRAFRRGFSGEVAYNLTADDKTITFNQLDAMALHYRVPLALILLFTRVRAEVEESEGHSSRSALRVVRSYRAALEELESILADAPTDLPDAYTYLDHSKFMIIRDAYMRVFDEQQPPLFF